METDWRRCWAGCTDATVGHARHLFSDTGKPGPWKWFCARCLTTISIYGSYNKIENRIPWWELHEDAYMAIIMAA